MYLSMWIIADNIKNARVEKHIISGEMCIRNASVLFEAERYRPHTVYVSSAEDASGVKSNDVICINKNDYFIVRDLSVEEVYEQVQDIIDHFEEWDLQVRDKIEEKCTLQEVVERAAAEMHAMMGVMNAGFIIQSVAGKEYAPHISEAELSDLQSQTGIPIAHVTTYGNFLKDHLDAKESYIFQEPVIHSLFLNRNILLNGWLWGFCFLSVVDENVPESRKQLFKVFYEQVLSWQDRNGITAERPEQNNVFMDLLTGSSKLSKGQLWEYMNRIGWAESDEKYVCVIREQFGNSLIYMRLIHQISQTFSQCYILQLSDQIVLVVNSTHLPIEILTVQLGQILSGSNVQIGISYPFENLFRLPQYLEQANIALANAREHGLAISFCSDCAISYTKNIIQKSQAADLEHPVLKQIRKYDSKHGTELLETLRTYVTEERSLQRTADALSIHKNTLLYRLKRLQELFPIDLSDREERLRLLLSFMLYSE